MGIFVESRSQGGVYEVMLGHFNIRRKKNHLWFYHGTYC